MPSLGNLLFGLVGDISSEGEEHLHNMYLGKGIHLWGIRDSSFAASPFVCHPLFSSCYSLQYSTHTHPISHPIHHLITHHISISFNSSFTPPNSNPSLIHSSHFHTGTSVKSQTRSVLNSPVVMAV